MRLGFAIVTYTAGAGAVEKALLTCDQCGRYARPLWLHQGIKRLYCGSCSPN